MGQMIQALHFLLISKRGARDGGRDLREPRVQLCIQTPLASRAARLGAGGRAVLKQRMQNRQLYSSGEVRGVCGDRARAEARSLHVVAAFLLLHRQREESLYVSRVDRQRLTKVRCTLRPSPARDERAPELHGALGVGGIGRDSARVRRQRSVSVAKRIKNLLQRETHATQRRQRPRGWHWDGVCVCV